MSWRFHEHILRGELDNRTRGRDDDAPASGVAARHRRGDHRRAPSARLRCAAGGGVRADRHGRDAALAALALLEGKPFASTARTAHYRTALFQIREDLIALIARLRGE